MVGGDYIQRNMSAAAIWGRIVNIAYQERLQAEVNFAPMLMKRLTLLATTLARARSQTEKGAIRDALLREVWPLIERGRIRPVVDRTFPLAEAQAPMRAWQERTYRQDSADALKPARRAHLLDMKEMLRLSFAVFAVAVLIAAVAGTAEAKAPWSCGLHETLPSGPATR